MWTRQQLKEAGKMNFRKNYIACVVVTLIAGIIGSLNAGGNVGRNYQNYQNQNVVDVSEFGISDAQGMAITAVLLSVAVFAGILGIVLKIFVGNVLIVGGNRFYIENRTGMPGIGTVLSGFRSGHYGNIAITLFLKDLFVSLWSLLLIIPGIYKYYEYYMVSYILADNPGMDRKEAFAISKRMMDGEKWNTFVLELSFLGWLILGTITCGLGNIFYVSPYMDATRAELYNFMKEKAFEEGYIR